MLLLCCESSTRFVSSKESPRDRNYLSETEVRGQVEVVVIRRKDRVGAVRKEKELTRIY